MSILKLVTALLLFLSLEACLAPATSVIVGDKYDADKNQTTLTVLPYGGVSIPGKWIKTGYNQVSRQHFFANEEGIKLDLALAQKKDYPFYNNSMVSNKDYLHAFYKWDSDYFKQQGYSITILEDKPDIGYLVWQIKKGEAVNTIFLFGCKNHISYNFSITASSLSDEQKQTFIVKLFNDNYN